MTVHRARNAAVLAAVLLLGPVGFVSGQSDAVDARLARNQQQFRRNFDKLDGKVANLEEKVRLLAESSVSHPELLKLVGPLADYYSHAHGNQKAMLLEKIIELACQNNRDSCELKRRMAALERRLDELENQNLEPIPIEPTPVYPEPDHDPVPPARYWDGTLDRITDRSDTLCLRAVLVRECVNYPFADGDLYHGNVYLDCRGHYVLVRHAPRSQYRSVIAYR
jgi:hypothetical protein